MHADRATKPNIARSKPCLLSDRWNPGGHTGQGRANMEALKLHKVVITYKESYIPEGNELRTQGQWQSKQNKKVADLDRN